jgi:hypothetical protein
MRRCRFPRPMYVSYRDSIAIIQLVITETEPTAPARVPPIKYACAALERMRHHIVEDP